MEDRPSGRTMVLVKPGVSPGLNGEGFMGQVKDFGLYLTASGKPTEFSRREGTRIGLDTSQMSELFGKFTLGTIWRLNGRRVEISSRLLCKSR